MTPRPTIQAVTRAMICGALRIEASTLSAFLAVVDHGDIKPIRYQSKPGVALKTVYALDAVHRLLSRVASDRYGLAASTELQQASFPIEAR